ncbi:MAG TPA: TIGR01459 family HAD-type hydrolase [Hyphomicrobiales bacterium]|nr:TIGR01459 family HAD-type hydrolase [Hyphomicrobiales bacterium]
MEESVGPRRIAGLSDIAENYQGLLCDVWGVVHNGVVAHQPAVEALRRFRDAGGRVVLITNSPRPARQVREQLRGLQVADAAYDAIVSSGDVTRNLIAGRTGAGMYHLGPDRDKPLYEGLDFDLVPPDRAEFVLLTGLFNDEVETPDDYRELLAELRARDLEVICANPDLVVERGGRHVYCAGALAQIYEEMSGDVVYAGKPHPPIYEAALQLFAEKAGAPLPKRKILAIGDGIGTDLKGAAAIGLDMLFITSGIHAKDGTRTGQLERLFADASATPRAVLEALVW